VLGAEDLELVAEEAQLVLQHRLPRLGGGAAELRNRDRRQDPRITTTIMISISVKPAPRRAPVLLSRELVDRKVADISHLSYVVFNVVPAFKPGGG